MTSFLASCVYSFHLLGCRQLLEAVAVLHEHGVVHRDIKGANIFLTDDMQNLKLGDFGCAVKIKAHTTMPGELQGFVGTQGTGWGGWGVEKRRLVKARLRVVSFIL